MEVNCALCHEPVVFGANMTIDHRCGCYTHTKCHVGFDERPRCPIHVPNSIAAKNIKTIEEPISPGPDWVTTPESSAAVATAATFIKNTWSSVKDINKKNAEDVSNPFALLGMRKPVEWMIRVKKLGLKDMYEQGVRLSHFLDNGYRIQDLCLYKDIGKLGPERGLMALKKLGMNADMLLDHTDKLPLSVMREKFNLTAADICEDGTLAFHPERGLRDDWSLDNLVYMGLTFKDLQRYCGLKFRRHWDALEPTQEHMDAMKCTKADINLLISDVGVATAEMDYTDEVGVEGDAEEDYTGEADTRHHQQTLPPPVVVQMLRPVAPGGSNKTRKLRLLKN